MKKQRFNTGGISRRTIVKGGLTLAAVGGVGTFLGPWRHNRVWAQGAKPIKLGLTCDASGQYGNSGQDDVRGIRLAIDEFNAKGGALGRKVEWITADTETNPATGTRVAERFISQEQCAFLIGAVHSGVANAITQVASKYGTVYLNTNSSAPSEAGCCDRSSGGPEIANAANSESNGGKPMKVLRSMGSLATDGSSAAVGQL